MVRMRVPGRGEGGERADTHGKLLVVNLFILQEKTATGYTDTILNTLRNKTGRARARFEISSPEGISSRVYSRRSGPKNVECTL